MGNSFATLIVVTGALFTDGFLYGLIIPLTPHSPAHITEDWMLGMMYTGYSIGVILATLFSGALADKVGRRKPMLWGIIFQFISIALIATATNFPVMFFARVLQGASAAVSWTAGLALLADYFKKDRAGKLGFAMMGGTAGLVLGPVVGGLLFDHFNYVFPFLFMGLLSLLDAALRWFWIVDLPKGETIQIPLLQLIKDPDILAASAITVLGAWCWCVLEALLPNQLWQVTKAPPSVVGTIFTVGCIVYGLVCPAAGTISDRLGTWKTITIGLLSIGLLIPFLSLCRSLATAGLVLCLVNTAYALMMNPAMSELCAAVDRRGSTGYASVYSVYNIAYSVGMMGSGLMSGYFSSIFSFSTTLFCTGIGMFACFLIVVFKRREELIFTFRGTKYGF